MLVSDLRLSGRAAKCLHEEGIDTVRDLVGRAREELLEVRNFGETTLQEIEEKLQEIGLRLGMEIAAAAEI
jgi:DNA-directed RNA polymerase subunit alpha